MTHFLRDYDFYRHIPKDLTEQTSHGTFLSTLTLFFFLFLFYSEFKSFLSIDYHTNTLIDQSSLNEIRQFQIDFDITLLDISCSYAVVDIVDSLGTRIENITYQIEKYQIDLNGNMTLFNGINPEDMDILHETFGDIDLQTLYQDGIHAPELNERIFDGLYTLQLHCPYHNPRLAKTSSSYLCKLLYSLVSLVPRTRTYLGDNG